MAYEYVFMIPDIESFRLVPHMTNIIECLKLRKFSHDPYGRGPEMVLLHIGWRGKLRRCFWRPIWAPWKWNSFVGNYFPKSLFLCTNWPDYFPLFLIIFFINFVFSSTNYLSNLDMILFYWIVYNIYIYIYIDQWNYFVEVTSTK